MLRIFVVVALATATFAVTVNSHAQANKYPEYHKVWEDGALKKSIKKEIKAKMLRPSTDSHGRGVTTIMTIDLSPHRSVPAAHGKAKRRLH